MNLILDTNILIALVRSKNINDLHAFINPDQKKLYISIVTEAEIRSFSIRNQWGVGRMDILESFLDEVGIIDINQSLIKVYVEIDSFSQRSNAAFTNYNFSSPRNMGKNDLWIASSAAFLGLKLITTDTDFDHLDGIFFEVKRINPAEFVTFF